jgi:hypothetical protein
MLGKNIKIIITKGWFYASFNFNYISFYIHASLVYSLIINLVKFFIKVNGYAIIRVSALLIYPFYLSDL